MKKKIYICMSILMVFLLSLTIVHGQDLGVNGLSDTERQMMQEYKKGNINSDEFIAIRKSKAEEYGLVDYCDSDYFLDEAFYTQYADAYLIHNGLMILDRYSAGYSDVALFTLPRANTVAKLIHHRFEDKNGYVIPNGLWQLSNSHYAFCAEGLNAQPNAGDPTSAPYTVDNVNLRKCLYYGYNGPGDILTARFGESGAVVLTDELVSNAFCGTCVSKEAHNGYHWKTTVNGLWNEILSKPEPKDYQAYMVDIAGSANNWQGVNKPIQKLTYGVYTPKGSVQLKKRSNLESLIQNNSMYSLKGAKYGLFMDSSCKDKIADLIVDENGNSNVVSNLNLQTYYVKEVSAPYGYVLDTNVYSVEAKENQTVEVQVQDVPQSNLVSLVLKKRDEKTGDKPQGTGSLKDAHYEFKFYGGLYDEDPATKNQKPLKTWVLKTDKTGQILMNDSYKVSGDDFYKDLDGKICLPLGTITVKEVRPPQGYLLDTGIYVQKLDTKNSQSAHIDVFKSFSVEDKVNRIKLVKVQEGTDIGLSGVKFKHTMESFPFPFEETTNEKGEIEMVGLSKGKHTLEEFKTLDGYVLDIKPIEFHVLEDGSISGLNSIIRVENKVHPYSLKIVKKNEAHQLLDGAVFGLFKDKECTDCIEQKTTKDGVVQFENLKNKEMYYIKEIKAPSGYQKNKDVYCLNTDFVPVNGQYDVYINQEKADGFYVDGKVEVEFVNQKMTKLPHTGSNKTLMLVLLGIGMMYIGIKRSKNE